MDSARYFWVTCRFSKDTIIDPLDVGISEVSMGHEHADIRIRIQFATIPVADMAMIPQDLSPLGSLERYAIGAGKASAYEADVATNLVVFHGGGALKDTVRELT